MITTPLSFIILLSIPLSASDTLDSIKHASQIFAKSLPQNTLTDIVTHQNEFIDILSHFRRRSEIVFPMLRIEENSQQNKFLQDEESHTKNFEITTDIYVDLMFIGFPAKSLDTIRTKWLDSLKCDDRILASIGVSGDIVIIPGGASIRYHFHLIQLSFHVADALTERLQLIYNDQQSNFAQSQGFYLNAFEIEQYLSSLVNNIEASRTTTSETIQDKQTSIKFISLFMLNLDLRHPSNSSQPLLSYSYRNGYSLRDLEFLSKDSEILSEANSILNTEKRKLRIELEKKTDVIPINGGNLNDFTIGKDEEKGELPSYWSDAVEVSRDWSKSFRAETLSKVY